MPFLLRENQALAAYHTFGLQTNARYFIEISDENDILEIIGLPYHPKLILGSGSNILFRGDFSGLVIKNNIQGITIIDESDQDVWLEIGGGVVWHDLVLWTIEKNYGGLENLSLIPGTVGAAPIQNIGAYGVEFDSIFQQLNAIDLHTGVNKVFDKASCDFGYRNSIFKNELKGQFIIVRVRIKLSKNSHQLHLSYGDIKSTLENAGITQPGIKDVSDAVIAIRSSKLPDPKLVGNAGSFYKNPVISQSLYEGLLTQYPDMPGYLAGAGFRKVPAAWLIEQAGWKGFRKGDSGVSEKHALVLVNYGSATAEEMHILASTIMESIRDIFGIMLETEVNII
jgi:UDP-N-acetylmuramate dehydrogenase